MNQRELIGQINTDEIFLSGCPLSHIPIPDAKKLALFCDCRFYEKAGLWPGSKDVSRKKHRPSYFGLRIADFGFFGFSFSIRIPQSAFRNLVAGAPTTE
jgi:hypothetical protein